MDIGADDICYTIYKGCNGMVIFKAENKLCDNVFRCKLSNEKLKLDGLDYIEEIMHIAMYELNFLYISEQ
jgi:hypothetical protein